MTKGRILIVGGGVCGLAIGWYLARGGHGVTILERGRAGRGATWAAAGMLAPQVEAEPGEAPLLRLIMTSRALWRGFAAELETASGQSVDYRDEGTLVVALDADDGRRLRNQYEFQRGLGLELEWLSGYAARKLEPHLAPLAGSTRPRVPPARPPAPAAWPSWVAPCATTSGVARCAASWLFGPPVGRLAPRRRWCNVRPAAPPAGAARDLDAKGGWRMFARLRIGGLLGAIALGLAGCGFTYQELRDTQPGGTTDFQRELFLQYKALADAEAAQFDWRSADRFSGKALAARTSDVMPDSVDSRHLVPPTRDEIVAARARLLTALDGSGRAKAAKDSARAQVRFDCWMEQQEEARQSADIEACKRDFLTAIAAVEVALKPVAAAPAPARPAAPKQTVFLVYFGHNSAEIGIEPKLEINKVAREFAEQKTNSIAIIGHSDRSGNPQANLRLSRKRARAVADTLVQLGVPRNKIRVQSVGEGRGLVATPDGVKEPQNRVVEIRLQP